MHYYSLDNYSQMNMVIRLLIVLDFKDLKFLNFSFLKFKNRKKKKNMQELLQRGL